MKRFAILILLSFALFTISYTQIGDTNLISKHNTYYTSFDRFITDTLFADTSLLSLDYCYSNSVFNYRASLSNHGSSFYSFTFDDYSTDFLKLHNYQNILKSDEIFNRYNGDTIYTDLFYAAGPDKNKRLNLDFGHKLTENWSYNLKVRYTDGKDAFVGDTKDKRNFNINTSYVLPSKLYSIDFGYLHRKIKSNENGGVDTSKYFYEEFKPIEYSTNFRNANYFYKKDLYILQHKLGIAPLVQKFIKDSLCDMGKLVLKNEFIVQKRVYKDSDTLYFPDFQNAKGSFDSAAMYRNIHTISWEKDNLIFPRLSASVGIQNDDISISDSITKYTYNSTKLVLQANYLFKDYIQLRLLSKTTFQGDFAGDVLQKVNVGFNRKEIKAKYSFSINNSFPRFMYLHQNTNHYQWHNEFEKERSVTQNLFVSFKGLRLDANMRNISYYTYLDKEPIAFDLNGNVSKETVIPRQYSDFLTHLKFKLAYELSLKFVQFKVKGIYQKVSKNEILPLPEWIVSSSLSYTHQIFHAATISIGTDAMMHAKYYARTFDPALQEFYLQDKTLVGEYLYLNAFFKMKLKRVNLFVVYSNIGAHFLGKNYYEVPEYPLHPNGVYYGLSWRFYN